MSPVDGRNQRSKRRHLECVRKDPALTFDIAAGTTPSPMRAEQRLQDRSRNLRVRSLSASDLRHDAEEDEACLPSTAATQEPQRENKKKKKTTKTQVQPHSSILVLLKERTPYLFVLQRERRHVECVQNNDYKREVSTSHDHHCSQPTSERGQRPITSGCEVGLHFGLRPPAFDLRPSASGLRPSASASGLQPPAFRQSDTAVKVDTIWFHCSKQ